MRSQSTCARAGSPWVTATMWPPAASMSGALSRSASRYSRQNGQPKCRRKARTSGFSCQRSDSATSAPSPPRANVRSGAASPGLIFMASPFAALSAHYNVSGNSAVGRSPPDTIVRAMSFSQADADRLREATETLVERERLAGIALGVVDGDDLVYSEGVGFA